MDSKQLFAKALQHATACIGHVDDSELANSTPCSEWDLRALLHHMVYELLWVPELVKGKTVAQIGSRYEHDVLGHDFQTAWKHAADAALNAVHQADLKAVAHLSYADVPMDGYIYEIAGDILVHTWDMCQAINCTLAFDEEVARLVYDKTLPRTDEFTNSGLFGKPIILPERTDIQAKLLGLMGRRAPATT